MADLLSLIHEVDEQGEKKLESTYKFTEGQAIREFRFSANSRTEASFKTYSLHSFQHGEVYAHVLYDGDVSRQVESRMRTLLRYFIQEMDVRFLEKKSLKGADIWNESFINCPDPMVLVLERKRLRNKAYDLLNDASLVKWDSVGIPKGTLVLGQDYAKTFGLKKKIVEQEKFVELALLASSIAHELNNPLSVMRNFLFFLEQEGKVPLEISNSIKGEISKIEALTDQMLRKIKGLEVSIQEWVSLNQTMDFVTGNYMKRQKRSSLRIQQSLNQDLWLYTDRKILEELLNSILNLCYEEMIRKKIDCSLEIILLPGDRERSVDLGFVTEIPWDPAFAEERNYDNLLKFWSLRSQLAWPHLDELAAKLSSHIVIHERDGEVMIHLSLLKELEV